jgi:hypothetical protein
LSELLTLAALALLLALIAYGFAPGALARLTASRGQSRERSVPAYDPGRELRAERKARELLRSVVSADEFEMYSELGFISVGGRVPGYAYLLYPHRPIVAYDVQTGELLNEYCVTFPDRSEPALGTRLPDADDILAKWMSLKAGERALIGEANMHVPGRQVDPDRVRRDLARLRSWRAGRGREGLVPA